MKECLRNLFMAAMLSASLLPMSAQRDRLILRDGAVIGNVRVLATTTDSTLYQEKAGKRTVESSISNDMIYLIKYQKRGNVYFTLDGKQFTGDIGSSMPGDATAIYLLEGRELWGYNLIVSQNEVSYQASKKRKSEQYTIPKDSIFLILYPDETRDVLNDFSVMQERHEAELERERQRAEAERIAREAAMFPKAGRLRTVTGKQYQVTIVAESDGVYVFTRDDEKASPVYKIRKENVSELDVKYIGQ